MRQKLWYHIATGLSFLILLGVTLFVVLRWPSLPAKIPTQFDGAGLPTGYGGKGDLIVLMVVAWGMLAVMTVLSFFPRLWNVPGAGRGAFRIASFRAVSLGSAGQSPRALQAVADMLAVLRPVISLMNAWLLFCSAQGRPLGAWFLPAALTAVFGNLLVGLLRARRR